MFLSTSVLNNLMKKAYKTGLVVARTQDAQENDWLYLAGSYWEVSVNKDFIPKKTLGDIITLIGELPRPGERFKATKEGNQIEIEMPMAINEEGFGTDTLTITDVLLIGTQGTVQRLLQDEQTGQIYPVNNVFVSIINNAMVEEDKGEYTVTEPLFNPLRGILWKNNVCKLRAHFRTDDKNIKVLKSLILLVNPVDYFRRVLPATRMLTPDGIYASVLPVDAEIIQSAAVPEGKAVYGMATKYFLGVGMAKNGKIEYSDEYRFLEDERVYLIKLYAHGFALDNNAFQVLDIKDLQPLRFKVVSETEKTKTDDATLADLKVGALKLSPTFAAGTTEYTATTQNASNTITAVPASSTAEIEITVGDVKVTNGAAANWSEGSNTVTVKVTDGAQTKSYKVTVTKE